MTTTISPSAVSRYAKCGLSGKLTTLGLEIPDSTSMPMKIGIAFHEAFQMWSECPVEDRKFELLTTNVGLAFDNMGTPEVMDTEKWLKGRERALQVAAHYFARYGKDPDVTGGVAEGWLEMPIVTIDSEDYVLRARLDYVIPSPDAPVVHELKTTASVPFPRDGSGYMLFNPQLQMEGMLAEYNYGGSAIVSTTVVWPSGADRFTRDITNLDRNRIQNKLVRVAKNLHNDVYPAVEGYWCGQCAFRDVCTVRILTGDLPGGLDNSRL